MLLHHSLQCYYTDKKYWNFIGTNSCFLCLFARGEDKRSARCPCDLDECVTKWLLWGSLRNMFISSSFPWVYNPDLSFNSVDCSKEAESSKKRWQVISRGSYTPAVLRWHVLYRVIATLVVQEGKFLFESCGPAAGPLAHPVFATLLPEARPHHVLHGDVIALLMLCALAAAVAQQHRLVTVIAEAQFAHGQLQLPQRAELRLPGSFSPPGLLLTLTPTPPLLPVKQGPDHMLKLALREALEHDGNWQRGDKST